MPNKFRSSFSYKLNDKTYDFRPTFEAVAEFIDRAGIDPFEALRQFEEKKSLSLKIIVAAVYAGIVGECAATGRKAPSFEEIGNECQAYGFQLCSPIAIEFLYRGVGSDEFVKKLEEAREKSREQVESTGGDTPQDS